MKRKNFNACDTSDQLILTPYKNGICLIYPELAKKKFLNHNTAKTVKKTLEMPFNSYFLNKNSIVERTNHETADMFGLPSAKHAIGKSIFDSAKLSCARQIRNNDLEVINSKKIKISDVAVSLENLSNFNVLSIKLPWYSLTGEVIGIFGSSIILGKHPIADFMQSILYLGLLNQPSQFFYLSSLVIDEIYLTERECDISFFLVRGKTANEIANILHLSKRTVENYLENIKNKFNVNSRSQLIEKLFDHFISNKC